MPELDCMTCTDRQKVARGCHGPPKNKVKLEGQLLDRCPRRLFLDEGDGVSEVLWYYKNYKSGLLPVTGGLLDQPNQLMEYFRIIDGAMSTVERAKDEENAAKRRADEARAARGGGRGRRR